MLTWSERIYLRKSQPLLVPVALCCIESGRANTWATSFPSKSGVGQCREELISATISLAVVCDTLHQFKMHLLQMF